MDKENEYCLKIDTQKYFTESLGEERKWREKVGQRILMPDSPVARMEAFCINVVLQELKVEGLRPEDEKYVEISRRTARVIIRNRKQNLIGYSQSKEVLKEWILWKVGLRKGTVFDKMERMGLTGDVLHDMEIVGRNEELRRTGGRRHEHNNR